MHEHSVAHRNLTRGSILMDGNATYSSRFYPLLPGRLTGFWSLARPFSRATAPGPIKYYVSDFACSLKFSHGAPRTAIGLVGSNKEVWELSDTNAYDPFKVDVLSVGNLLRRNILQVR